jgi:hypothetical protein
VTIAAADADVAVKKVAPLVDHADATVGSMNASINELHEPLHQDLLQMQATMEQAKSLIASIQTVARGNDDGIHTTTEDLRVATEGPKDRKVPELSSSQHSAASAH